MARAGIPRLRYLRNRVKERIQRQPIIMDFLAERVATAPTPFPTIADVWTALKANKAVTIAAIIEPVIIPPTSAGGEPAITPPTFAGGEPAITPPRR